MFLQLRFTPALLVYLNVGSSWAIPPWQLAKAVLEENIPTRAIINIDLR